MARGTEAKRQIIERIKVAFAEDFLGEYNSQIYVWANDGGAEKVQIAITLTCPKVEVSVGAAAPTVSNGGWDFDAAPVTSTTVSGPAEPAEITEEEKENIATLLARLGL